jgi:hypothetical protein
VHSHGIKFFTKDRLIEDVLHGMALGVEQSYNGYVLQLVVTLNVFGSQKSIQDERHHDTIVELRSRIRTYYKDGAKLNPLHKWSKIDKLTLGMLGTLDSPSLHAKGGETSDFTRFCVELSHMFSMVDPRFLHLALAGDALIGIKHIMATNRRKMHVISHSSIMTHCVRFLRQFECADGHWVPKFHRFMHMCRNVSFTGNPKYGATWWGEHENGLIAKVARCTHADHFTEGVFLRILVKELLQL